jgi:hypothetical protein
MGQPFLDDMTCFDESEFFARLRNKLDADRSGPDDGSDEVTTELMGYMPEESDHANGSPLNFGYGEAKGGKPWDNENFRNSVIDGQIALALQKGW